MEGRQDGTSMAQGGPGYVSSRKQVLASWYRYDRRNSKGFAEAGDKSGRLLRPSSVAIVGS